MTLLRLSYLNKRLRDEVASAGKKLSEDLIELPDNLVLSMKAVVILVVHFTNTCRVEQVQAWPPRSWQRGGCGTSGRCFPPRDPLEEVEEVVLGELPVERLGLLVGQFFVQLDPQFQLL
jgi:hypothetical protein